MKLRIIAAALSTVALVGWAVPADAAPIPEPSLRTIDAVPTNIQGWQIKDGTLYGADLNPALIPWFTNTYNNTVGFPALRPDVTRAVNTVNVLAASADPQEIGAIGGPIAANGTQLSPDLVVPPGKYLVTVSGQIDRTVAASDPGKATQPQISLWFDNDNDGVFEWQDGEGSISPNGTIPDAKNRSVTVSGTTVVTITEETHAKLIGFGYAVDGSGAGSNELTVANATLVLMPLR